MSGSALAKKLQIKPGYRLLIFSVAAVAKEFPDWSDGSKTDAQFSQFDDGAQEALALLIP